jgi:hypothetical protein
MFDDIVANPLSNDSDASMLDIAIRQAVHASTLEEIRVAIYESSVS